MVIENPDTLSSVYDARPGDYLIHTDDRRRIEMFLEIKGIMGTKFVVNYVFGKWTRPQDFLVYPSEVHKAEDIYANDIRLFGRYNAVTASFKYEHIVYLLKNM